MRTGRGSRAPEVTARVHRCQQGGGGKGAVAEQDVGQAVRASPAAAGASQYR